MCTCDLRCICCVFIEECVPVISVVAVVFSLRCVPVICVVDVVCSLRCVPVICVDVVQVIEEVCTYDLH